MESPKPDMEKVRDAVRRYKGIVGKIRPEEERSLFAGRKPSFVAPRVCHFKSSNNNLNVGKAMGGHSFTK